MREPGGLQDLGAEGASAWDERLNNALSEAVEAQGGSEFVQPALETSSSALTVTDWTGFPGRVASCLMRERALQLLDVRGPSVCDSGRKLQEEYVEWRAVKSEDGIQRVELTTELPDYWRLLAAYAPARLLEIVSDFAREKADPQEIFGACDPLAAGTTPEERESAFVAKMIDGASRYNNGQSAICCMAQRSNNLEALVRLAVAATQCRIVRDAAGGQLRCLSCSEAIPLLGEAAQLGRYSDPVLVERLGRIAFEGRELAFDDPVGIYILGVEHARLRAPGGDVVPREWFTRGRGVGSAESADGRSRYQRLTFEVPQGEGFAVGDLVDIATEQPIRYGGQIADLVVLAVFLRVSVEDVIEVDRNSPIELEDGLEDALGCADLREVERRLLEMVSE